MKEVLVAEFGYRHEAEFAQGFLRDAGIPSRVASDDAGGVDLSISFLSGTALFVADSDRERALQVLESTGLSQG